MTGADIRQAAHLQRQGRLLREIAAELRCDYWDVVRALYGDPDGWPDPPAVPVAAPVEIIRTVLPAAAPPPQPMTALAAPQVAPAAGSVLYRLANDLGEWLHRSGSGMTRNPDAAWRGTEEQMREALRRKPHLRELVAEVVA